MISCRARAALVLILVGATLLGCTRGDDPGDVRPEDVGIDLTAAVDPDAGTIVFPAARFGLTAEEQQLLVTAFTVMRSRCAQGLGVDWRADPVVRYSTLEEASHFFGVWTEAHAARFAFVAPMTNADLVANGYVPEGSVPVHDGSPEQADLGAGSEIGAHNAALSEEDLERAMTCNDDEAVARFSQAQIEQPPGARRIGVVMQGLAELPEAEQVYADLDRCFEEHGLTPDPEAPGMPEGWELVIDEEQISLALQTVACKTEVDLVPRLADLVAEQQAPILAEYADELVAYRADLDTLVAEARAVVADAQAQQ